jgi:hypothetical protein
MQDGFFWHLVIANAWILATSFHIDCGPQGALALYGNNHNSAANWSDRANLRVNNPYDKVEEWRGAQQAGKILPGVARPYGRIVDDSWQTGVFSEAPDLELGRAKLREMLKHIAAYRTGVLADAERGFYAAVERVFRESKSAAA